MANPFFHAMEQLDKAIGYIDIDPQIHEVLKRPERFIEVAIPVRMGFNAHSSLYSGN